MNARPPPVPAAFGFVALLSLKGRLPSLAPPGKGNDRGAKGTRAAEVRSFRAKRCESHQPAMRMGCDTASASAAAWRGLSGPSSQT
jgi:hypothetical protein